MYIFAWLLLFVADFILTGFVAKVGWNWFPHELLHAPHLGYWAALGLTAFAAWVTNQLPDKEARDNENYLERLELAIVTDTIALAMFWFIHSFI